MGGRRSRALAQASPVTRSHCPLPPPPPRSAPVTALPQRPHQDTPRGWGQGSGMKGPPGHAPGLAWEEPKPAVGLTRLHRRSPSPRRHSSLSPPQTILKGSASEATAVAAAGFTAPWKRQASAVLLCGLQCTLYVIWKGIQRSPSFGGCAACFPPRTMHTAPGDRESDHTALPDAVVCAFCMCTPGPTGPTTAKHRGNLSDTISALLCEPLGCRLWLRLGHQ